MLMFPAKLGMFFLPPPDVIVFGILLSETMFWFNKASAVLFLALPFGPGHPSQPSLSSLTSP